MNSKSIIGSTSRRQLLEQLDKPALKPLPMAPYVYAEWKKCILNRIIHNAHRIELEWASMRKTIAKINDKMPQT